MARTTECIYKRKDGRWEARYIISHDMYGKAKYRYLYANTYEEARQKLITDRTQNRYIKKIITPGSKNEYSFWLEEWLKMKKASVKPSTYIRYRNTIKNHIAPDLGCALLSAITRPLIERFLSEKKKRGRLDQSGGLSAKSMENIVIILKDSLKYAKTCGAPVLCDLENISFKKSNPQIRVLSSFEQQKLLTILQHDLDRHKLGVFLCLYTGIRVGELCALKWKNISFSDKTLKIDHTMQRLQQDESQTKQKTSVIITDTKSFSSTRTIPLPDFLLHTMKPFQCADDSYLLSGSHTFVEPRTMQNHFKTYITKAEIADANFHCLRHTFATRCIEAGFDVKTLSEILGHSSVKITLDRYVHSSLQLKRSNMEKLQFAIMPENSFL